MRYQQLKDILIHLDDMHVALARLYQRWLPAAEAEHSRRLLAYMHKREEQASEEVARCLTQTDPALLHGWFDVQVEDGFSPQLQRCRLRADPSVEGILEQASELDRAIIGELESIREHLPARNLAQWLEGLVVAEHNRSHHLIHNAQRLDQF